MTNCQSPKKLIKLKCLRDEEGDAPKTRERRTYRDPKPSRLTLERKRNRKLLTHPQGNRKKKGILKRGELRKKLGRSKRNTKGGRKESGRRREGERDGIGREGTGEGG